MSDSEEAYSKERKPFLSQVRASLEEAVIFVRGATYIECGQIIQEAGITFGTRPHNTFH